MTLGVRLIIAFMLFFAGCGTSGLMLFYATVTGSTGHCTDCTRTGAIGAIGAVVSAVSLVALFKWPLPKPAQPPPAEAKKPLVRTSMGSSGNDTE